MDSVHIQVHERELGMPAVLANERRLAAEASHLLHQLWLLCQRPLQYLHQLHVLLSRVAPKLAASLDRDPLLDDFSDDDAQVHAMFGSSTKLPCCHAICNVTVKAQPLNYDILSYLGWTTQSDFLPVTLVYPLPFAEGLRGRATYGQPSPYFFPSGFHLRDSNPGSYTNVT